jgi:hypothetical protein
MAECWCPASTTSANSMTGYAPQSLTDGVGW